MIENILSSKSKREFCLADIVKETGSSFGTIHPAMKDLVSSRVVSVRKLGKSKIYKINRSSVFYPVVNGLFAVQEKAIFDKIISRFFGKLGTKNVKAVILFGSFARGDFTEKSDIDVLFITDNKTELKKRVDSLAEEFLKEYDVDIMPVYFTEKEFKERKEKFDKLVVNVLNEGKIYFSELGWLKK
jgi:predicted nucleotidyltransferase